MPEAVPRRTVVVMLLVVTILSASIGAVIAAVVADQRSDQRSDETSDASADARADRAPAIATPFGAPRRPYTPVAYGNGVRISATWRGNFARSGRVGVLSITGRATAPWTGQGFLELSLPPGWRAQQSGEAAAITGWAGPNPSAGVHYGMIGVVHPGATRIRFIAIPRDAPSPVWFAVDGVNTPTTFTGDADPGHQTEIHAVGWVLLD